QSGIFCARRRTPAGVSTTLPGHTMLTVDPLVQSEFDNQEHWLARLATGEPHPLPDHPRLFRGGTVSAARIGSSGVTCVHAETESTVGHALAAMDWLRRHRTGETLVWS